MMRGRVFLLAAVAAIAAGAACGSNNGAATGGSTGTSTGAVPQADCEMRCGQIASSCGLDPSMCSSACAQGLTSAQLDCAAAANCDPSQIAQCLQSSSATSSSTGTGSMTGGSSSSTGTSGGPSCIADGQSGCSAVGPHCCSMAMQGGSHVICNNGVCCASQLQNCTQSIECCAGTSCVFDPQFNVTLCE
jgi:hypothetical protein